MTAEASEDCGCSTSVAFADLTTAHAGNRVCFKDLVGRCSRRGRIQISRRKAPPAGRVHLRRWDFGQANPISWATCSPQDDEVYWSLLIPTRLPQIFGAGAEDALSLQYMYSETQIRFCEGDA